MFLGLVAVTSALVTALVVRNKFQKKEILKSLPAVATIDKTFYAELFTEGPVRNHKWVLINHTFVQILQGGLLFKQEMLGTKNLLVKYRTPNLPVNHVREDMECPSEVTVCIAVEIYRRLAETPEVGIDAGILPDITSGFPEVTTVTSSCFGYVVDAAQLSMPVRDLLQNTMAYVREGGHLKRLQYRDNFVFAQYQTTERGTNLDAKPGAIVMLEVGVYLSSIDTGVDEQTNQHVRSKLAEAVTKLKADA